MTTHEELKEGRGGFGDPISIHKSPAPPLLLCLPFLRFPDSFIPLNPNKITIPSYKSRRRASRPGITGNRLTSLSRLRATHPLNNINSFPPFSRLPTGTTVSHGNTPVPGSSSTANIHRLSLIRRIARHLQGRFLGGKNFDVGHVEESYSGGGWPIAQPECAIRRDTRMITHKNIDSVYGRSIFPRPPPTSPFPFSFHLDGGQQI